MKPKRIILVRHGESVGNADPQTYEFMPDYKVNLSDAGIKHAIQAGEEIRNLIKGQEVYVYTSPWQRTRDTYAHISQALGNRIKNCIEDPRIREQEWGHLRDLSENAEIKKERIAYGTFYFRIPDGESGADVYDRVSSFLETMHRDFQKPDYPDNALIITHGVTLRIFLMRWFHWTPEYYEKLRNPKNGDVVVMERSEDGYYRLQTKLSER